MPINWMDQAQAMRAELVARRRDFHRHPELAFQEKRTAGIVATELNTLGLEVITGVGQTGVVGILEGQRDGPTVLVRFDMDALPVEEQNQTDYVSEHKGKMHACGHDGHMAIGLGLAKLMSAQRENLAGRIKFVFQPAEEIAQGAPAMIKDGVLDNPRPTISLGLHLWNDLPFGEVGIVSGPMMTGADTFTITIRGSGGHGALPEQTRDPIVAGAQVINTLQTIVSRNVSGLDQAVVSVTTFHAGDADNVIPPEVKLTGTFRTFRADTHELVERRLKEITTGVAAALQCEADVMSLQVTPPLVNDPATTDQVRQAFEAAGIDLIWRDQVKWMAAEDMAFFLNAVPGTFLLVGSADRKRHLDYPHHHPRFDFDEDVLPVGVGLLATAVAKYVLGD